MTRHLVICIVNQSQNSLILVVDCFRIGSACRHGISANDLALIQKRIWEGEKFYLNVYRFDTPTILCGSYLTQDEIGCLHSPFLLYFQSRDFHVFLNDISKTK